MDITIEVKFNKGKDKEGKYDVTESFETSIAGDTEKYLDLVSDIITLLKKGAVIDG
jgi:hypothetical protein